ncbi:hypothetical protein HZB90_04630 [archaeon]|nr:hypothetical protein [archaeon]
MKKGIIPIFCLAVFLALCSIVSAENVSCPILAYEGSLVQLSPAAFDPDPEIGPAGALMWSFGPPFDEYGQWQTRKGQRGIFPFWVSVSDGELSDTKHACVELLPNNKNPIVLPMDDVYITRGDSAKISASCYDPDGDPVTISYKFNGKDVAFIYYEPPGVYDVEAICTDGFGGVGIGKAKLHILMPAVVSKPKPKPAVILPAAPAPKPKPAVVEVSVTKKNDTLVFAPECVPCDKQKDNIDVVVYDGFQDVQDLSNQTTVFVIEDKKPAPVVTPTPAPVPAPAPAPVVKPSKTGCDKDKERQVEVSKAIGKCC